MVTAVIDALAAAGFDIAHPFDPAAVAAAHPALAVLAGPERLGVLVGNSRALWERFVEAMSDPGLAAEEHPLDRYTERTLAAVAPAARVYFSHRRYAGRFVPMQQVAVATGLGAMAPTQLVIHPRFGPWFALRAVVLLDGDPPARAPVTKPCRCDACPAALAAALASAGHESWRAWLAVRDACTLRDERYSDDQIHYHYLKVWRPS